MTNQLSETEFQSTFGNEMTDVTQSAEPVVDIWEYAEKLVEQNLVDKYVYDNTLVEKVYRNDNSTFEHVLLPTSDPNIFIALVVDLVNETILGHFRLDLNKEYGLSE